MFEFLIDDLEGKPLLGDLENVGACYPDDDVIYMFGIPCRLSSARPTPRAADGVEVEANFHSTPKSIERRRVVLVKQPRR